MPGIAKAVPSRAPRGSATGRAWPGSRPS